MIRVVQVAVYGQPVGTMSYELDTEAYRFVFDEDWLDDPDRPLLGQLFEDRRPYAIESSGMPAWFANLLPQGSWRPRVHRWAGLEPDDDFGLLVAMGSDLPGAVTLTEIEPPSGLTMPTPIAPAPLKTALAGAQTKLSARHDERGLVVPVRTGESELILKFASKQLPMLPQAEHATMTWARACGMDVAETRVLSPEALGALPEGLNGLDALAVTRFDRSLEGRLHMEDFNQIRGFSPVGAEDGSTRGPYFGSYTEICILIAALAPSSLGRFLRQLVFCLLAGNGDAHLKNWSLLYPRAVPLLNGGARLAPAYDLVPTRSLHGDPTLALTIGSTRRWDEVTRKDVTTVVREGLASSVEQLLDETITAALETWPAHRALFPRRHRALVGSNLESMAKQLS